MFKLLIRKIKKTFNKKSKENYDDLSKDINEILNKTNSED